MNPAENNTIYDLVRTQAERAPDAISILSPGRASIRYRQLVQYVDSVAEALEAMGIGHRDRIAVVLPNGPEMAVTFLAVASRAACAPLNPAYRESEFDSYLSDLNPKLLIVQHDGDSPAIAVAQRFGIPVLTLSAELTLDGDGGMMQGATIRDLVKVDSPQDVALLLYTSGTTSKAKLVPLTHANLLASAQNIRAALALNSTDRCLNVMPLYHVHGLIGALLTSLAAGGSIAIPEGFDSSRFPAWLEEYQPSWYTAVPTIHHAILDSVKDDRTAFSRHGLRFIRSSSAPLPGKLMAELEETFQVPVIEAYGMTEASHQIASNLLPPGKRKAGSVGMPAGTKIAIMNEAGDLLSPGVLGEIVLRGANITRGYEGNSEINYSAFTDSWFRTGDEGYIDADGYLFITGRLKEMINRGGEKLSPLEVEAALLDHSEIADAVAFPIPHPTLGEDIAAAVVMKADASITEHELQRFLALKFAEFKIPRRIAFLRAIPKGPTGKIQRVRLAHSIFSSAVNGSEGPSEFKPPRTDVETKLIEIWCKVLKVENISTHHNFFDLGGDSLKSAQIINRARRVFNAELSFQSFFETPTVAGMADTIKISRLCAETFAPLDLDVYPRTGQIPVSFAQRRIWFLCQLDPENPIFNRPVALRLVGALRINTLERCLNEIMRRHEILRTTFPEIGGEPVQVPSRSWTLALQVTDLSSFPETERWNEALKQAIRDSIQSFDLANGPLFHARLFHLDEQEHLLLLLSHHILWDGWSDSVLVREMTSLYQAFDKGQRCPLSELPFQYADYAAWQRSRLKAQTFDEDISYWKRRLNDPPPLLNLPTDRPRPAVRTTRGARNFFALPASLCKQLRDLSRCEGVTLFMTLLAVFKTLLYRYTGQTKIWVGVPVAGRNPAVTEDLIGVFINTLVLRTTLTHDLAFRELLQQVREASLEAFAHQELPFEKLVEILQPTRNHNRQPLFDVMFQLRNFPQQEGTVPGLKFDPTSIDIGVSQFDLTLEIEEKYGELECCFEYSTDLFDGDTILRMQGHFRSLLDGIVANSDSRLSDLPLVTEAERYQLLVEWNDTKRNYPTDKCIYELFEEQVERTPEAVAVVFEGKQLTYRELNQRANQLSSYLRKFGVKPDTLVGICVEPSLEMVIGILGIMKAGGAYVPLDPAYPNERLKFMLSDCQASLLLTQQCFCNLLAGNLTQMVCIDTEWRGIAQEPVQNVLTASDPANLAYVIYTSGSTGTPKGVLLQHSSLVSHLFAASTQYEIQPADKILQFCSLSFDVAAEEMFPAWLFGASLVVSPQRVLTLAAFDELLKREKITVVNLPASYWHEWIAELKRSNRVPPESLRLVIVGNEKVSPKSLTDWRKLVGPRVRWLNAYGPTEAAITTTIHETVYTDVERDISHVPIGRPIANKKVYILDQNLQPVPVGTPGEIYIGGDSLARGYLNNPQLTEEKFIGDPFSKEVDARVYKTGDLARYLPNGEIEFLGRMDEQVKVRGYRIELGEIEVVMEQHSLVKEAVVVAHDSENDGKYIAAYVIPQPMSVSDDTRLGNVVTDGSSDDNKCEIWPSIGEYPVYDELMYSAMTNDRVRVDRYRSAINGVAKSKTVLDVGTGKDMVLARLCIDAGAEKVYAVEISKSAFYQAKRLVDDLGLEEKIILIHGDIANVDLPEKVDLCVSEIIGTIGGSEGAAVLLNHARRFVKPGGMMVPQGCATKIAAVTLPDGISHHPRFTPLSNSYVSKIFAEIGHKFDVRVCIKNIHESQLLSSIETFENINLDGYVEPNFSNQIDLTIRKKGRLDGFLLWINLAICGEQVIDSLRDSTNWLPVFFPVFWPGIEVSVNDRVLITGSGWLSDNGVNPDYRLQGKILRGDAEPLLFEYMSYHHKPIYKDREFYKRLFGAGFRKTVSACNSQLSAGELMSYLAKFLPSYMLPSVILFQDVLPKMPNGKVDRQALSLCSWGGNESERVYVTPRSPLEEVVAGIWADVLKLDHVSVVDNFFDLGGHSLLAVRVASRLRDLFEVNLPLQCFFDSPTVAALANCVVTVSHDAARVEQIARLVSEVLKLPDDQIGKRLETEVVVEVKG